jgi:ribosome-associated translation inhibitor RaiA
MELRVSAPGNTLTEAEVDRIQRDLEKIDRRLKDYDLVYAEVRISNSSERGAPTQQVTLELEFGRNHFVAKAEHADIGQAVREARDEILRQINDRKRARSHSDYTKRR